MAERLNRQKIENDIFEMWDAINHIPANDPDRDSAIKQAQEVESKLRTALARQDLLDLLASDMLEALKHTRRLNLHQYEAGTIGNDVYLKIENIIQQLEPVKVDQEGNIKEETNP